MKTETPAKRKPTGKYEDVLLKTNRDNGNKLYKVVRIDTQELQGYFVKLPDGSTKTGNIKSGKSYYYGPAKLEYHDFYRKQAIERYKG